MVVEGFSSKRLTLTRELSESQMLPENFNPVRMNSVERKPVLFIGCSKDTAIFEPAPLALTALSMEGRALQVYWKYATTTSDIVVVAFVISTPIGTCGVAEV